MRPIKFRCWNKTKSKYFYSEEHVGEQTLNLYFFFKLIEDTKFYGDEFLELEQFTGLYDKNGNDIYREDIVKFINLEDEFVGKVKFGDYPDDEMYSTKKHWGYWIEYTNTFGESYSSLGDSNENCEIIGNIHENPELLETK